MKRFQVTVFGKQGCDKCKVLKNRLEKILAEKTYADFEIVYYDLGTVDGLVWFCQCEVLNPQRLPSFMIFEKEDRSGTITLKPLVRLEKISGSTGEHLNTFVGLETDYTSTGTLTPKMIRRVLDAALKPQEDKIQV